MPDREEERDEPIDCEPVYRDGSLQNECWSDPNYTKRNPLAENSEDLSVLRGD